jgi:hypothetical protein
MSENPLLARSSTEKIARKLILRYVTVSKQDSELNRFRDRFSGQNRDRLLDRVFRAEF